MGFPQRIDDEEFLRLLDEAEDAFYAQGEAEAKQAAEVAAPIVLTMDGDELADVTEVAQE